VTEFSQEVWDTLLTRIISGESLREICRDPEMPARESVRKWLLKDDALAGQYARACELRSDELFDEIEEIAHDGRNDWMERAKKDGSVEVVPNHENVNRSRLRVDMLKWKLSKMVPKKYGDKVEHDHGGEVGVKITKIERVIVDPKKESA
jgi:hypothetical protein